MTTTDKIKRAEEVTNTSPTELQKEKGNYKKGKVTIKGLKITIENPIGSVRSGKDKDNNEWEIKMPYSYGYFNRTLGKDGDQFDVYLGTHLEDFDVFIVDQVDCDSGAFDEHKIMFGFKNETEAKQAYLDCYEENWKGFGCITKISLNKFKIWLNDSSMNKYPASKLNMSSKIDYKNIDLGDRISLIRLFGEVEADKTLANLMEQAGDEDNFDKLIVEIASPGGSVSEGLEIMMWLDGLSAKGKQIITVVVANAYSIASLIMLSANIKLISKHGKVMVHNPMVPELKYVNANELEKHIVELRELEGAMYDLYEMFTGLEKDQIKSLMDEETYLSPQEAVDYGFADMVVDIKPKSFEMTTNNKKDRNMSNTINSLKKVIAMVNQSEYVNQTYTDTDGAEIEIFQTDAATYKVGDRTSLEEGTVTLSDGAKVTTKDFLITEIDRSVDPEGDADAAFNEGAAPEKAVEEVIPPAVEDEPAKEEPAKEEPAKVIEKTESTVTTKEIQNAEIKELSSWEVSVVNDSFEIGTVVEYKPYNEGDEPSSVGAGEYQLEDGRKILTDADGIVRFIKPAEGAPAEEAAPEAKGSDDAEAKAKEEAEAKAEIEAKDKEEMEAKEKGLEAKVEELEAKNKELEAKFVSLEEKMAKVNEFEETAAKAIDTIASSVTSNFSPEAKATVGQKPKGSIFQQLKQKRGL